MPRFRTTWIGFKRSRPLKHSRFRFVRQTPYVDVKTAGVNAEMINLTCRRWLPEGETYVSTGWLICGGPSLVQDFAAHAVALGAR